MRKLQRSVDHELVISEFTVQISISVAYLLYPFRRIQQAKYCYACVIVALNFFRSVLQSILQTAQ